MRLQNTTVVMTGGATGLGRTYCERIVAEGGRVVIADIADGAGETLAQQLNERAGAMCALAVRTDVTCEAEVEAMAERALDKFGRIDVLVNNVGSYPHLAFDDISYETWRKVMMINLDSVFLCTKAVLPEMKHQGKGKIVNVATNLVWIGLPSMVHYIAAKGGVVGFTRALAREMGEHGITVNAIAPGAIIPPIGSLTEDALARVEQIVGAQSLKWCQRPSDVVGALLFLVSADSDFITGQILTVDGGLTNH